MGRWFLVAWERSDRRQELPPDWPTTRRRIFHRDGYRCTWRDIYGKRCEEPATDVDHIKRGNDHRDSNLRSLCGWHHDKKSAAEGGQAAAAVRRQHDKKFRRTETHPGLL